MRVPHLCLNFLAQLVQFADNKIDNSPKAECELSIENDFTFPSNLSCVNLEISS